MDKKTKLLLTALALCIAIGMIGSIGFSHWSQHPEEGFIGVISKLSQNTLHLRISGILVGGVIIMSSYFTGLFIQKKWQQHQLQQLKNSIKQQRSSK